MKFMGCGDFAKGFARVRCDQCAHEYLFPFSCKGRWFCPSCYQKKVQLFGTLLAETVLAPVPHRRFTFTISTMLHSGSWYNGILSLGASRRETGSAEGESSVYGFLVASVPEPSALSLLAIGLGGLALVRRRK